MNTDSVRNSSNSIAFTLFELITVILVMGILGVIAIPEYRNYLIRSKISQALIVLRELDKAVKEAQELADVYTGFTVKYDGLSMTGFTDFSEHAWEYKKHYVDLLVIRMDADLNVTYSCIYLDDVGIAGSTVTPYTVDANHKATVTASGDKSLICLGDHQYCGWIADNQARNVPLEYLPSNCQCTDVRFGTCP